MSDEQSDIEKLREWLDTLNHQPRSFSVLFDCECDSKYCGLTEARELAQRIEEKLGAWENGPDWMKAFFEEKAKLSTAEAERDELQQDIWRVQEMVRGDLRQIKRLRADVERAEAAQDTAREKLKQFKKRKHGLLIETIKHQEAENSTLRARVEEEKP